MKKLNKRKTAVGALALTAALFSVSSYAAPSCDWWMSVKCAIGAASVSECAYCKER